MVLEALVSGAAARRRGRPRLRLIVHAGTCGRAVGADALITALALAVREGALDAEVSEGACTGMCFAAPSVEIQSEGDAAVLDRAPDPRRGARLARSARDRSFGLCRRRPPRASCGPIRRGAISCRPSSTRSGRRQKRVLIRSLGADGSRGPGRCPRSRRVSSSRARPRPPASRGDRDREGLGPTGPRRRVLSYRHEVGRLSTGGRGTEVRRRQR